MTHKPRRFDLSPDNFLAGIGADLKADELGLYWLICLRIYSRGGPVPYDEQSFATQLNRTDLRIIKRASSRLQLLGKITVSAGQVMANGCVTPIEQARNRIATASENGRKGGRPPKKDNEITKPDGSEGEKLPSPSLPPPQPPSPKENILSADADPKPPSKKSSERRTYPEAFEAFWSDYPTDKLMSKKAAYEKWSRLSPEDREAARAAIPAFRQHCTQNPTYRPVHAERFISQRRFDGFNAAPKTNGAVDPILARLQEVERENTEKLLGGIGV